ncbi:ABC transporter substrate-binding protein [Paenibacillus sp. FSL H8-0548]|uniref:metal ABC transporter solute-binding protein, Zn/Mn family n=1 Tax=Paenibacillus sp. FSL H8-0548 TaxID=1920422 RepID=UPI00096EA871|nr:zinc ABC transporter substrate-binding protein [Paenibacillus sp. FSL H8-0548]OMF34231.1 ABC transporter substrate-binding protein [Paenibacillus sp. FSL H8-0548]
MKDLNFSKRFISLSLLLTAMLLFAAACGNNANGGASSSDAVNTSNNTAASDQSKENQISIVTSFYPLYFLASEIGGDHVNVDNLVAAGVEPHDWTPKSRDLSTASKAQLFLYHGAGLEGWVEGFLKGLSKDSTVITKEISDGISLIEGSEDEHEHTDAEEHEHEHEDDHADEEAHDEEHDHGAVDPHTWVSPKSALKLAENVKNSLIDVDSANQADYEKNYNALLLKIEAIDADYTAKLAQTSNKNIVTSHQAFGYLARDYGLKQISIMGLSPDAEPRAQDLLKISKYVKENNIKYIFFEELVSDQLAKTLASEADVETMVLNPLEGLTPDQEKAGETYLTLMERNLQNLVQALQ